MKNESIITLLSLGIFFVASFIVAYGLPIILNNAYYNNYTFDLTTCANLLLLYGISIVIGSSVAVGLWIHELVIWFKGYT